MHVFLYLFCIQTYAKSLLECRNGTSSRPKALGSHLNLQSRSYTFQKEKIANNNTLHRLCDEDGKKRQHTSLQLNHK